MLLKLYDMGMLLGNEIVGTWELISWVIIDQNGGEQDFYGDSPIGLLMYDNKGNVNVQISKSNRKKFVGKTAEEGTTEELCEAYRSYICYFGSYKEESPGKFIHHIKGGLFPNWEGTNEVRYAKIKGEYLYLSTPPIVIAKETYHFLVKWKRLI